MLVFLFFDVKSRIYITDLKMIVTKCFLLMISLKLETK